MIDASAVGGEIVAKLISVPELKSAMTGDSGEPNITFYDDQFPVSSSRDKALRQLTPPGMLVLYQGFFADKFGQNDAISHRWSVLIRGRDTTFGDKARYSDIGYFLQDGYAAGDELPLKLIQFDPQIYQMDVKAYDPKVDPQGLMYWEFRFNTTEIGDN